MQIAGSIALWGFAGVIIGFYVGFIKGYHPLHGALAGALPGGLVGGIGIPMELVSTTTAGLVTMLGVGGIAALLLPRSTYIEKQMGISTRTNLLAYALLLPTVGIVLGVVIAPLMWNVIFSVRPIRTADLRDLNLFDLRNASTENYVQQVGIRVDPVPCVTTESDSAICQTNEDGSVEYVSARRHYENYRGWREQFAFDFSGTHYVVGVQNRDFYPMVVRTLVYTVLSTVLSIVMGLIAALVVNDEFLGRNLFRGFLLSPYVAPIISVAFVWQVMLRNNGVVNAAFGTNTSFLNSSDDWLGLPIPLVVLVLFQTWRYFPFAFLFLLSRLQAIPGALYEAAKVDGATPIHSLFLITLPQLREVIGTLFLLRFIWTFNKFDDVFLLSGTISETRVISVAIFEALFAERNVGQASALSLIMASMLVVILVVYFNYFMDEELD